MNKANRIRDLVRGQHSCWKMLAVFVYVNRDPRAEFIYST